MAGAARDGGVMRITTDIAKSLIQEECHPNVAMDKARPGSICHLSPICQRCKRCIGHCTCPPKEQRFSGKADRASRMKGKK